MQTGKAHMQTGKAQTSLHIHAGSPESLVLTHTVKPALSGHSKRRPIVVFLRPFIA